MPLTPMLSLRLPENWRLGGVSHRATLQPNQTTPAENRRWGGHGFVLMYHQLSFPCGVCGASPATLISKSENITESQWSDHDCINASVDVVCPRCGKHTWYCYSGTC